MPPSPNTTPKFVTGSTLRHVISMTATGSIGLAAVFFVDVLNLFYISQLGEKQLAAAVGYAGTLLGLPVAHWVKAKGSPFTQIQVPSTAASLAPIQRPV